MRSGKSVAEKWTRQVENLPMKTEPLGLFNLGKKKKPGG